MSAAISRPGKVIEITSTANPVIKSIKALSLKKNREAEGIFIAEGMKLVTDALDGNWVTRNLIYSSRVLEQPALGEKVLNIAARVLASGGHVLKVNDKVLTSITRRDNPQMVVGVFEKKWQGLDEIHPRNGELWLALDRVRDPGNLGTIIRTADALGAKGVLLVGNCTDPFALETVRATMGSLFHMPLCQCDEQTFLRWVKSRQVNLIGTHLAGAVDHRTIDYQGKPIVLLMGNEQQGLPQSLAGACDQLALIAMGGEADSLNLAVATGIMLFAARSHALKAPDTSGVAK